MALVRARTGGFERIGTGNRQPDFTWFQAAHAGNIDLTFHKLPVSTDPFVTVKILTLATLVSVAASVTTVGCMTLCTARLNMGSIRLPVVMADPVVPVLLLETPETAETLDLSDVERVNSAPRVVGDTSSEIRAGDSDRVGVMSVPVEEPLSLSGKAIEPLAGEDWVEGIMLPMDGERAEKTDDEAALSRPRLVLTTSWTCRFKWFLEAVGGGFTMIYVC